MTVGGFSPPPDPHPHPVDSSEQQRHRLPDVYEASDAIRDALDQLDKTRGELDLAHNNHAEAEKAYRKRRFELLIAARDVKVDGKPLTADERKHWVDAELADDKAEVRKAWGLIETARAAVTFHDRRQASLKAWLDWSMRELHRHDR